MINVVFSSKAFVGGAVALILDSTLHRHDSTARRDRGDHFWDRFRSFKTDPAAKRGVLLPAVQPQQVLPIVLIDARNIQRMEMTHD
jgi:hypothetical protein